MEPFINVDLGPTVAFAVEVEREPQSHKLKGRARYVEIRSEREVRVRGQHGWVDLVFSDSKARAAARRRIRESRTLIARLQLGDHFQRADRLAGQLRLTAVQREIVQLNMPLVIAFKPEALGGGAALELEELSKAPERRLLATGWRGGPAGPLVVIRNEVLPTSKSPRIDLLTTDGWALVGSLQQHESGVRLLIEKTARCTPDNRWGAVGLVRPEQGLRVVPSDDEGFWMRKEAAVALSLPSSPVIDAWSRYHKLERLDEEDTLKRRAEPLAFDQLQQRRGGVRVRVQTDRKTLESWFEDRGRIRKSQRVSQAIELQDAKGQVLAEGELTRIEDADRSAGRAWAKVRLREGRVDAQIASRGLIVAVADEGQTIQAERRQAAAAKLATGDLPNFRLAECLVMPRQALLPHKVTPRNLTEPYPNSQQLTALKMALGCRDLVVVQGPPGTGKTRVLAEVVRQLHRVRDSERGPIRVLLSAPQNDATSHLVAAFVGAKAGGLEISVHYRTNAEFRKQALKDQRREGSRAAAALVQAAERDPDFEVFRDLDALERKLVELAAAVRHAEPDECVTLLGATTDLLGRQARFRRLLDSAPTAEELAAVPEESAPRQPPVEPAVFGSLRRTLGEPISEKSSKDLLVAADKLAEIGSPLEAQARHVANSIRRDLMRDRPVGRHQSRWDALRTQLPEPNPGEGASSEEVSATPSAQLLGWLEEVRAQVWTELAALPPSRALVRWRLGRALERRPMGWGRILREYASVSAATCQRAAVLDDDAVFDLVIVDEAGRASPLDLLIPLTKAKAAVLIGDQNQLPPSVEERLHAQLEQEVEQPIDLRQRSFFAELYDLLPHGNRIMLEEQYRMHETIGGLVSDQFYGGRLRSYWSGARSKQRLPDLGWFENRPLVWVDVGQRIQQHVAHEHNVAEQEVVAELLDDLKRAVERGEVNSDTQIGLITFYSEQRRALKELLDARPAVAGHVTIGTVDSFQGKEFPVVVLSTVRHDPARGRVGFLRLPNRINVAFSRAQRQLIVLGSAETMQPRQSDPEAGSTFLAATVALCQANREDTLFVDANALNLCSARQSA